MSVLIAISIIVIKKDKPVNQNFETSQEQKITEMTTIVEDTTLVKPTDSAKADLLESIVDETGIKYNAMGIQVATVVDGKVHATAQYGWAEENERPITSNTKIRVASLSKTTLSLVVFRLIEDGLLELDTDVSQYLGFSVKSPSYPNIPITLRQLLAHSSGLANASYVHSFEQLKDHLQKSSSYTKYKPGTHYEYNNFAYGIIGTICERVTGKSVTTLLNEYFLIPMGISASYFPCFLNADEIAVLYDENHNVTSGVKSQQNLVKYAETAGAGFELYAGGLTISAKDYAKLLTILINDGMYNGVRYLSTRSIELIHSVQSTRENDKVCQGMPVITRYDFYGGKKLQYHTGSAFGVYSLYVYDRATKTGVVIVTTGARQGKDTYGIYSVCSEIASRVYEENVFE